MVALFFLFSRIIPWTNKDNDKNSQNSIKNALIEKENFPINDDVQNRIIEQVMNIYPEKRSNMNEIYEILVKEIAQNK